MHSEEEIEYKLLKLIDNNSNLNQRSLAEEIGVSLGKINYCLKALMEKGLVKAENFKNSQKKRAYIYLLTPHGIKEKTIITRRFLDRKITEYEALRLEIEDLKSEVGQMDNPTT